MFGSTPPSPVVVEVGRAEKMLEPADVEVAVFAVPNKPPPSPVPKPELLPLLDTGVEPSSEVPGKITK